MRSLNTEILELKENVELQNQEFNQELTRTEKLVSNLQENHLDLQSRQDNLLFYNIPEKHTNDKNVEDTVRHFLSKEMNIPDSNIKEIYIDRCHRIGKKDTNRCRAIVAKLATSLSKQTILRHGKHLAGKKFSVSQQQPREYEERKKQLIPLYQKPCENKVPARWFKDKLFVNDKLQEVTMDTVKDINIDVMALATSLKVKRAPPTTSNGSTFQGSSVNITSTDEIIPAIHAITKDTRSARGTHNMYAYRIKHGDNITEHFEDNGEYGAGRRILSLMQDNNMVGTLICVTRWHFGLNIGPKRFELIKKAAESVCKI